MQNNFTLFNYRLVNQIVCVCVCGWLTNFSPALVPVPEECTTDIEESDTDRHTKNMDRTDYLRSYTVS